MNSPNRLRGIAKLGVLPFATSAIMDFLITASDVVPGAAIARGVIHTANHMLSLGAFILLLLILGVLGAIGEKSTSRTAAVIWKSYVVILCASVGFVAGTATVTLYLSHRLGVKP